MSIFPRTAMAILLAGLLVGGCNKEQAGSNDPAPPADTASVSLPANTVKLDFVYGSEKQKWVEDVTAVFNKSGAKLADGRPVYVQATPMGSGECIEEVTSGHTQAHLISPASSVFVSQGNAKWRASSGADLIGPTENLVVSPVVIAMWKPMAEALGWPGKPIGWSDVLALARNPQGWGAYGHPEWGAFKLGHTHPEHSNSGLISVLAEVYAASGKVQGLTAADLNNPQVASTLDGIEGAVVHYGSSTGFFADRMFDSGPSYLSAAVLYESSVADSYSRQTPTDLPVVAVYPREGTFWSDHPIGIVQRDWVKDEHREAAKLYINYLRAGPQQRKALQYGFRPGDTSLPLGAPIDPAHGVNPDEPKTTLEVPPPGVVDATIELWRHHKKHANIVLVLDTSGSMNDERKMPNARAGATELIDMLDDEDTLSLLPFSTQLNWAGQGLKMKDSRDKAKATVAALVADGETALYDSIAAARQYLLDHPDPSKISAIVVLTDGEDNKSSNTLDQLLSRLQQGSEGNGGVRVFTIAYGSDARQDVLQKIAQQTRAKFYTGKPENIRAVFKEIATFF
jgi:Ca-activated chloride channel family protein